MSPYNCTFGDNNYAADQPKKKGALSVERGTKMRRRLPAAKPAPSVDEDEDAADFVNIEDFNHWKNSVPRTTHRMHYLADNVSLCINYQEVDAILINTLPTSPEPEISDDFISFILKDDKPVEAGQAVPEPFYNSNYTPPTSQRIAEDEDLISADFSETELLTMLMETVEFDHDTNIEDEEMPRKRYKTML